MSNPSQNRNTSSASSPKGKGQISTNASIISAIPLDKLVTFADLYRDYYSQLFDKGRLFEGIIDPDDAPASLEQLKSAWPKYWKTSEDAREGDNKLHICQRPAGTPLCSRLASAARAVPLRVLLSGQAECTFTEIDEESRVSHQYFVCALEPNDVFGEFEFLGRHNDMRHGTARADVHALSRVTYLEFGFNNDIYTDPDIPVFFWRNLASLVVQRTIKTANVFEVRQAIGVSVPSPLPQFEEEVRSELEIRQSPIREGDVEMGVGDVEEGQYKAHYGFSRRTLFRNIRTHLDRRVGAGLRERHKNAFGENVRFESVDFASLPLAEGFIDREWAICRTEGGDSIGFDLQQARSFLNDQERNGDYKYIKDLIVNLFKNPEVRAKDANHGEWIFVPSPVSSERRYLLLSLAFREYLLQRLIETIGLEVDAPARDFLDLHVGGD